MDQSIGRTEVLRLTVIRGKMRPGPNGRRRSGESAMHLYHVAHHSSRSRPTSRW